jgi:uncharacterized repeat protein (TIGR02543 family)
MKKLTIFFFVTFAFCLNMSAQLPSAYDPRTLGMISPPSNQGSTNNCWIHSSVASLEMNQIRAGGPILKYSENYYNYLRTMTHPTNKGGFIEYNPYAMASGALDGLGYGISVLPIFNYMVNWLGPVLNTEFPYSLSPEKLPLDMVYIAPSVHVQGYEYLAPMGALGGPTNQEERVLQLKTAVYNNGAATIGDHSHSVAIIGWDDSRNGGSFLAKNSYGNNNDYWITYNSTTITGSAKHSLSVNHVEPANNYFQNYFHTQVMSSHSRLTGANSVTMANVFTREITAEERIDAVGFSTVHPNTAYEIYINPNGNTLNTSSLVKVGEGRAEKPGFRTIKTTAKLLLNATSTEFAVAVKYTLPTGVTTFDFEAQRAQQQQGPAPGYAFIGINAGECFFTTGDLNSAWTDMARRTFPIAGGEEGPERSVNVPIRAYTNIGADAGRAVVMFNPNGGSAIDARTVASGSTVSRPANPTRGGHTFGGWFSDKELTEEFDFGTAITASIILYAKWTSTTAIGLEQGVCDMPLRAWVANGVLHIGGLTVGEIYRVYTISGTLVYQGIATGNTVGVENFRPLPNGTYIIQSENKSVKIVW